MLATVEVKRQGRQPEQQRHFLKTFNLIRSTTVAYASTYYSNASKQVLSFY